MSSAQNAAAHITMVRALKTGKLGIQNPAGLAFSRNEGVFHIVPSRGTSQSPATDSDILMINSRPDKIGSTRIPAAMDDPINMTFDNTCDCLLVLLPNANILMQVKAGRDGSLEPNTLTHFDARQFDLQDPQGMAVDSANGDLLILDSAASSIVRVARTPEGTFDEAGVSRVDLQHLRSTGLRGLAVDPTNGHLHVLDSTRQVLDEITSAGEMVAERDLSRFNLKDPRGMVFAPSGDQTDDPMQMSLYLADSGLGGGRSKKQGSPAGRVVELSLAEPVAAAASSFQSVLIRTTDTAALSPPSPDSSGLTYLPLSNTLLMSDSEVEEVVNGITHFQGANLWEMTLSGEVVRTANISRVAPTVVPMTDEPSGVAWNSRNGHYYFSDDDKRKVWDLNPGADGLIGTADDTWTSFDTVAAGNDDPEGITYDSLNNTIFVVDGVNSEVYEYTTTGTLLNHFDVGAYGVVDPESIEFNPVSGTLYVLSNFSNPIIIETTTSGALLETIDFSAANAVAPAGLAYAPASSGSGAKRFYIVDRGIDNNVDPNIIDGKMYEMSAPSYTPGNQAPSVEAGADQTVTLSQGAQLQGSATDDGVPYGTLTVTWSKASGPGTVTFSDANDLNSSAMFSSIGNYVLRLIVDDGELVRSDDVNIKVMGDNGETLTEVRVGASADDAEESAGGTTTLTSSDLELVYDGSNQTVGMRFNGIDIPRGATVTSAYVQFMVDEVNSEATALTIRGENTDQSAVFTSVARNISSRSRTAAAVSWGPKPWTTVGAIGVDQRTPNIASVIQEIVNLSGWASGNSLAIIITGTGHRTAVAYDGSPAGAPLLHVEYRTSVPTITSLNPTAATAGGTDFALAVNGTNFVAGATVRWNGANRTTTFVSSTQLTASITAADIVTAGTAQVTVFTSGAGTSNARTFTINNPAPAITSLNPATVTAGGAAFILTVDGTNFVAGSTVRWNGADRTTTFVSSTQLAATITAADITTAGTAQVTVYTSGTGTSNAQPFTINNPVPAITGLSPTEATAGGVAFSLTVNGTNFGAGATVRWNGTDRATTFVSSTHLTASISAADIATAGTIPVTVFNPAPGGGTSVAQSFTINYPVPTMTSLSPTEVTAGGEAFTLTVSGTNYINGSTVRWNGTDRTTTFVSSTQLKASITAADIATAGTAQVTVFTPAPGGGTSNAATFTINSVQAPTITSLSPATAMIGGAAFTLTVNGTNFLAGSTVRWNGTDRTTTFVSSTQLTAAILAGDIATAGTAQVTVFTSGAGTSNAQTFTISNPAPAITGLSPTEATVEGGAFTLTVNGSNFVSGSSVRWNGADRVTTFASSTQLTASITAADIATAGTGQITVFNPAPGGGTSGDQTFAINNPVPTITSVSPTEVTAGATGLTLTVNGTKFVAGSKVRWNGADRATTFVSTTQLTVSIAAADIETAGTAQVTVFNPTPGGGASGAQTFTINNPTPAITGVSPAEATAGGAAFTLTVNGTNFVAGSTVRWNGADRTTTFVSPTQLMASITAADIATAGTAQVTVFNPVPGGGASGGQAFTINNPPSTIASLSPSTAMAGGDAFTLTVIGTNFVAGSTVRWNGVNRTTIFVSATQLTASIAAADIATAGTAQVTVFTSGTGTSNAQIFTINNPVPTIAALSPAVATVGGTAFTLTIDGTNFVTGSTVRWKGTDRATTFVSATQLTASITAADIATAGTAQVTVFNPAPGGGTSGAQTFTIDNPVPAMVGFSPTEATVGGGAFILTVNGANFVTGATVRWNGANRTTTFVSATQLTASIAAADIATAGTIPVTVFNPAPGGGTSGAQNFTINNPAAAITGLSPTEATVGGGSFTLTVNGTNFVAGSIVRWNGLNRPTTFVSATQLTASIGAVDIATAGTIPVTVFNPAPGGGTSNAATFTINSVQAPTITSLSPAVALAEGGAFTLVVNGTNFVAGSTVRWNGTDRTTTFISATQLTAAILAGDIATAGTAQVTVFTSGSGTSNVQSFSINNPFPAITSLSPAVAAVGGGAFVLTVNGTNFVAASTVLWNGSSRATAFVSPTQLTASIGAADIATAGTIPVTVFNPAPGGGISNAATFTIDSVQAPTIANLSPASTIAGGGQFTITVNGTNFVAASTVLWNGSSRMTTFVSATRLTAAILAGDIAIAGTAQVTVFTSGAGTSNAKTFTINSPAPAITSLNPDTVTASGPAFALTVNGSGFTGNSVVRWNGSNRTTTLISPFQLTAAISKSDISSVKSVTVTVYNPKPGGGTSNALILMVNNPVPTTTSLSPATAYARGLAYTLTVNGTGFVPGAVVLWNGTSRSTTFSSSTKVLASISATDIAEVGAAEIEVLNPEPGGGISNIQTLTISNPPVPVNSGLSPNSGTAGGASFTLTVSGSGFVSDSRVRWDGSDLATTVVSSTRLTTIIPAEEIASGKKVHVSVFTPAPGGGTSNERTFTVNNPMPAMTGLSPSTANAGAAAFTLTINGSGFVATSVVRWNGSDRTTTFVSATQLTAAISAADIATFGTAQVTVFNPTPAGGTSTAQSFIIN